MLVFPLAIFAVQSRPGIPVPRTNPLAAQTYKNTLPLLSTMIVSATESHGLLLPYLILPDIVVLNPYIWGSAPFASGGMTGRKGPKRLTVSPDADGCYLRSRKAAPWCFFFLPFHPPRLPRILPPVMCFGYALNNKTMVRSTFPPKNRDDRTEDLIAFFYCAYKGLHSR